MSKIKNEVGNKYGRLYVIERASSDKSGKAKWACLCECGNIVNVPGSRLRSGKTKSCGCLRKEMLSAVRTKVIKHGDSKKRLYKIHSKMVDRCYNTKELHYADYGGRGITICDDWKNSYIEFRKWAHLNGYSDNLEIDRIDNNGPYSPDNCQWITHAENLRAHKKRLQSNNSTGYAGVCYIKAREKYRAELQVNGIIYRNGYHETLESACVARGALELKHLGKTYTHYKGDESNNV